MTLYSHVTFYINFGASLRRFCDIAWYSCKFLFTTLCDACGSIARFI